MSERKMVSKRVDVYWNYTDLGQIKEEIEDLMNKYQGKIDFRITEEYGDTVSYVIAKVPETDAQMEKRLKAEAEAVVSNEKRDKFLLESLIKKYGIPPSAGSN